MLPQTVIHNEGYSVEEMQQQAVAASGGGGGGSSSSSSSMKCRKLGQFLGEGDHVHRRDEVAMELRKKMQKLQQQQAAAASGGGISSSMKDCKFGKFVGVDGHVHGRELVGVDALPPSMMQMRMKMQKLQQQLKLEMQQQAAAASGGGGGGSMKSLKCCEFGQLVGEGDHVHRRREKIAMELRKKMQKLQQQRQAAAASGGGGGGGGSSSMKSLKCCKSGQLVGECDHVQRRRELVGVDVLPPSMMQFRMKVQKLQQAAAAAGSGGSSQQQQQAALMSNMIIRNVLSSNVRTISSEGGRNEKLSAFSDAIAEDATAGVMQLTLEPSITTTKEIRGHWRE